MTSIDGSPRVGLRPVAGVLAVLFAGAFAAALNVTLLSPLVPAISRALGISEAAAGQLATVTALAAGGIDFALAPLLDRRGRGWWLRSQFAIVVVGSLVCVAAPSFGVLIAARALVGLGSGLIGATCLSACADLFPPGDLRNRAIAVVNAAFTSGAIIGLPIVTVVEQWFGWRAGFALLLPLGLIVFLGAHRLPNRVEPTDRSLGQLWVSGYRMVLGSRRTLWLLATSMLSNGLWYAWIVYLRAMGEDLYAVSAGVLSIAFLAGGIGELLATALSAPLIARVGSARAAQGAILLGALDLVLLGWLWTSDLALIPFAFFFCGCSSLVYVAMTIATLDSLPEAPGAAMSLQAAVFQLGGAIVIALTGLAIAWTDDYLTVYRLLGVALPLGVLLLWRAGRTTPRLAAT